MNEREELMLESLRNMGFAVSCEAYLDPQTNDPIGYRLMAVRGSEQYAVCGETAEKAIEKFSDFLKTGGRQKR